MAVVRANYVKRGEGERATAKANISYIQSRPGHDKERLTRTLFGEAGFVSRYETYQFIDDEAKRGSYFYRFKLSPDPATEDTRRDINMRKLTTRMMQRLEKRLKTPIPWAAALHDDHTNIRHVHILAAIPKRLHTYELEFLIKEATRLCEQQRRFLDRGKSRLPWQESYSQQPLKTGKYTSLSFLSAVSISDSQAFRGRVQTKGHTSCTCPRCHFPQHHDRRGMHSCSSCGITLHKKKEQTIERRKGVEWGRSV